MELTLTRSWGFQLHPPKKPVAQGHNPVKSTTDAEGLPRVGATRWDRDWPPPQVKERFTGRWMVFRFTRLLTQVLMRELFAPDLRLQGG